jgi:hypothetical protein
MYGGRCGGGPHWHGHPCWEPGGKDDHSCYDFAVSADGMPKISCKTTRECVKTYKTYYKMYRICTYRLYKVCSHCGAEFDYYHQRGLCPSCR